MTIQVTCTLLQNPQINIQKTQSRELDHNDTGIKTDHTGEVAAGRAKNGNIVSLDDENAKYRDVEFLTPVPKKGQEIPAMPFQNVREITGKSFFWAATLKKPYLSVDEAEILANELRTYLEM